MPLCARTNSRLAGRKRASSLADALGSQLTSSASQNSPMRGLKDTNSEAVRWVIDVIIYMMRVGDSGFTEFPDEEGTESKKEYCPPLIAGSCARKRREPRQVRKEATVPANFLCRRCAWLSFDGHLREKSEKK